MDGDGAALASAALLLPFVFAISNAIFHFGDRLLVSGHRVAQLGLFYTAILGLLFAFAISTLSILRVDLRLERWSVSGSISVHPKPVNVILACVALAISVVFIGHLVVDQIACVAGNAAACD